MLLNNSFTEENSHKKKTNVFQGELINVLQSDRFS